MNEVRSTLDHSELCTNVIFKFSQLILEASARKKRRKTVSANMTVAILAEGSFDLVLGPKGVLTSR